MTLKRSATVALAGATCVAALALAGCGDSGGVSVVPLFSAGQASNASSNVGPSSGESAGPSGGSSGPSGTGPSSTAPSTSTTPSASSLVHTARATYAAAKSAHARVTVEDTTGSKETLDIKGTMDGSNQNLVINDGASGIATVRTVASKYYVQGDKTFWQKQANLTAAQAAVVQGKWVVAPSASASSFKAFTLERFLDDAMGPSALPESDLADATVTPTTAGSVRAYRISVQSDSPATYTVTADGKATVLGFTGHDSDSTSGGSATFGGWDTQATVTAPTGAINQPTI